MLFTVNHEEAFETGEVKDGKYEVVINSAKEDATPNGAEYLNLDLIIRNDFEQPFKNAHIFARVWKSKDSGQYHGGMLNTIGKAFRLPDGKSYKTMEELCDDLALKTGKVTVKNEISEYGGKTYENLNVKSWEQTELQGLNHQFKEKTKASNDPFGNAAQIDVSDDSLPF